MNTAAPQTHWLGKVAYDVALEIQEKAALALREGRGEECLYLLEHESVYTIGRTRDHSSIPDLDSLPAPVHVVHRGGQATWHGPGQLIGYPIIDLNRRARDLHRYLRVLETALVHALCIFEIQAGILEGRTGVWIADRKIASIGVGARGWITLHGFALNVADDLSGFDAIIPCGLAGVRMTSISRERGAAVDLQMVARVVADSFWDTLDRELPRDDEQVENAGVR